MKIAIINSAFLKDTIESYTDIFSSEHFFKTFIYKEIKDVLDIIPTIYDDYDAFFVNGEQTITLIKKSFQNFKKPMLVFNCDAIEYCHCLLEENIINKVPFERIFVDYLPDEYQGKMDKVLQEFGFLNLADNYSDYVFKQEPQKLIGMKDKMLEKIESHWNTGQYDIVITRFSTIMDTLKSMKINARFVYPSKKYIQMLLSQLIDKIALYKAEKNFPAVIIITMKLDKTLPTETKELANIALKKEILEFRQKFSHNFIVQDYENGYKIIASEYLVSTITNEYTYCKLQSFLKEKLKYKVNIGYGISDNINNATLNAISANKLSINSPDNSSYAKDINSNILGPLGVENSLIIETAPDYKVSEIAAKAGLSTLTLQRIMAAQKKLGTENITAKGLSEVLGVTSRSTNRFLSALEEAGKAEVVRLEQSSVRGRPLKVYKLLL